MAEWAITEDTDRCQKRTENILYGMMRASNLQRTVVNCNGAAARLNVNFRFSELKIRNQK